MQACSFLKLENIEVVGDGIPLFSSLFDPTCVVPFFNKWRLLTHDETNARSGIFIRCSGYVDKTLDLFEKLPLVAGVNSEVLGATKDACECLNPPSNRLRKYDNFFVIEDLTIRGKVRQYRVTTNINFAKFEGRYYPITDVFSFFCKLRAAYINNVGSGSVEVNDLKFSWRSHDRLKQMLIMFASSFYEWDIKWNRNRSPYNTVRQRWVKLLDKIRQ